MILVDICIPIITGVTGIILGIAIKKQKLTNIIAGFNPNKHDSKKVSNIAGDNIFFAGVLIIFFGLLKLVIKDFTNIVDIAEKISILLVLINLIYRTNKYGLKDR